MNVLSWLWVAPMVLILVVGSVWVARYTPADELPQRTWGLTPRLVPAFGRISGTILVLAAGAGLSIAIVWPFGYWARNSDGSDHKVFNWVAQHQAHWLHSAMRLLTEMSNNRQTQVVSAFFMVALTIVWFVKRRNGAMVVFAPAVLILAAYEIEHQMQHTLKLLAHRTGHNPPGLGAFPSGGCARLIACYGLILYLALRAFGKTRSKLAVALWTLLVAATYTEAYSRLYLGKHWISDIVGGLVLGVVLLACFISAAKMLDRPGRDLEATEFVSNAGTSAVAPQPHTGHSVSRESPGPEVSREHVDHPVG